MEPTPTEVEAKEQNQREYELRTERKELKRRSTQDRRDKAKSLGLCVACGAPPIPDQTRCPTCAEKHRVSRRRSNATRRQTNGEAGQSRLKLPFRTSVQKASEW